VTAPPFLIVGNPEHKRVALFQEALAALEQPPARVVSWLSFLADVRALEAIPDETTIVRVDSFGQSFAVEREMLRRGHEDASRAGVWTIAPGAIEGLREERGAILAPRQHHFGVERVLADLERVFAGKRRWVVQNPPASVRAMFDKRVTSARYASLGIPVPRALSAGSPEELRDRARAEGVAGVYVKLSCASSASCLAVVDTRDPRAGGGGLLTTIEESGGSLYNSRKLRTYRGRHAERILALLLREGSQIEERVPKARIHGRDFDCRVLVIAGEPAFTIVRESPHEITNLHLGGRRGDTAALAAAAPPGMVDAALASCARAAGAHDAFHVGVDVAFERGWTGHRVLEANAFGDFFPGLVQGGASVYAREIVESLRRGAEGIRSSTPSPKTP
jgi:glutathione synthase/RimK-type ligase-like ATP-grasp enzyme